MGDLSRVVVPALEAMSSGGGPGASAEGDTFPLDPLVGGDLFPDTPYFSVLSLDLKVVGRKLHLRAGLDFRRGLLLWPLYRCHASAPMRAKWCGSASDRRGRWCGLT